MVKVEIVGVRVPCFGQKKNRKGTWKGGPSFLLHVGLEEKKKADRRLGGKTRHTGKGQKKKLRREREKVLDAQRWASRRKLGEVNPGIYLTEGEVPKGVKHCVGKKE